MTENNKKHNSAENFCIDGGSKGFKKDDANFKMSIVTPVSEAACFYLSKSNIRQTLVFPKPIFLCPKKYSHVKKIDKSSFFSYKTVLRISGETLWVNVVNGAFYVS